jgi:hypothetical protein
MSLVNKFQEVFLLRQQDTKGGKKTTTAELSTSVTKGVLILSVPARKLLNIVAKDRLMIFDMKVEATSNANRFFITKGFNFEKKPYGMKINANGAFMDIVHYNLMLVNDFSLEACSSEDLLTRGLAVMRDTSKRKDVFTPKQKVRFEIEPYTEKASDGSLITLFSIAPGMPEQPVFQLVNPVFSDNHVLENA